VDRRWIDLTHDHVRIDSAGKSNETDLSFEKFSDPRERPRSRVRHHRVRDAGGVEQIRRHVLLPRCDGYVVAARFERLGGGGEQVDQRRMRHVEQGPS